MRKNIFVIGLDELNRVTLQETPELEQYRFHQLLDDSELVGASDIQLPELLDRASQQLESFEGSVDAIVGYWDFPVSSMVPLLCARFGLRSPTLDAVVRCEHKYWSRLEQRKVIDEHPAFALVPLEEEYPVPPSDVGLPMWLKPVKSASSELAFHVRDRAEFDEAVAQIREGVDRVGEPFDFVLSHLDLPPEIAAAGGQACLAERAVAGRQVTVEGYSFAGEVHVYGVVDSHNLPDIPSFDRFQYPSSLPGEVTERLASISARVIRQLNLDNSTFNIEYFWDQETGDINLLEVNPRHSQSHAILFEDVDGVPNHLRMVRLALGQDPALPSGRGPYDVAASWFVRRRRDGVVRRVPTRREIDRVTREVPGVRVKVVVHPGERLSELPGQDSYSYELARVYVGAADERELHAKYQRCLDLLPFEFDEPDAADRPDTATQPDQA